MEIFFTKHALGRRNLRCISLDEVEQTLEKGTVKKTEADGRVIIEYGNVVVVYVYRENTFVIITMYATRSFDNKVKKYSRKFGVSRRKVTKHLKGIEMVSGLEKKIV